MPSAISALKTTGDVALGSAVAGVGYASIIERNAFVLRQLTMPVLTPGSSPLRVLHISDIHMRPGQRRKQDRHDSLLAEHVAAAPIFVWSVDAARSIRPHRAQGVEVVPGHDDVRLPMRRGYLVRDHG